ncbi:MAG: laccase domain-containing protein [Candidatus Krumholzibacteriota bacterium]|nr:laccase domain-containing protein [Candidatus Krumholzibacteriota bacterium]
MMRWIGQNGLVLGIFPAIEALAPTLRVFFASRIGGVSKPPFDSLDLGLSCGDRPKRVHANRRRLLETLELERNRLARAEQVHGASIAVARPGRIARGADGLVTGRPSLPLAVSTADCYPVVLFAPAEGALAALHVGRAGAAAGILEAGINRLSAGFGANLADTIALVGPGICERCYPVRETDSRAFPASRRRRNGRWHVDLAAFIADDLVSLGLRRRNVLASGLCTSCDPGHFFSHRRDGGKTGRHWTIAWIDEP